MHELRTTQYRVGQLLSSCPTRGEMMRNSRRALTLLFLFVFVDVLGFSLILPLLPYYAATFGATAEVVGLLLGANALTQLLGAPVLGRLSDRYGRKPLLILSLAGTVAGFLMLGLARSLAMLFASRVVDGFLGGNISLAQAYISDVTEGKERTKGFGLVGAAFGLGFIIGPAMGGALAGGGNYALPRWSRRGYRSSTCWGCWSGCRSRSRVRSGSGGRRSPAPPSPCASSGRRWACPAWARSCRPNSSTAWPSPCLRPCSPSSPGSGWGWTPARPVSFSPTWGFWSCWCRGGHPASGPALHRQATGLWGALLLALSLLAWAFSPSLGVLLVVLAPLALASGVLRVAVNAALTRSVWPEEVGGTLGLSASLGSLSRVVAPTIGGFLLGRVGAPAPGVLGALLMAWLVYYTWRRVLFVPDLACPEPRTN